MSPSFLAAAASSTPNDAPADFILGETKPNASNTGLVSPTTTTDNTAAITLTAGSVVENVLFNGNVLFGDDDIHMYNCRIRGKTSNTTQNITRNTTAGITGITLERCQLDNRWWPSDNAANGAHGGIQGASMTLTRCDISGACDGVMLIGPGNVNLLGNYIHGQWFFSPDNNHLGDGTHSDGIQGTGSTMTNILIEGNTIESLLDPTLPNSQAIIDPVYSGSNLIAGNPWHTNVTPTFYEQRAADQGLGFGNTLWGTSAILFGRSGTATLSNLNITKNWLDGGSYAAINLDNGWTNSTATNIDITDNRLGPHVRDQTGGRPYLLICSSSLTTQLTLSGNVYEDTGLPITGSNLRRNG